jgi:DNA (cytosine-5)-methyltransferase 1
VITVTDLFCGAGGSSLGAVSSGLELVMAANHWRTAIDVHQAAFPTAGHDCADITQVDPRRYPRTDVLLASPECTNHSQARGVSRRYQDPSLFDAPDPSAERSRATMWDVFRFAEQMRYAAIVVENVVEATRWVGWRGWHLAMADLGYEHRVLSHNSMHHDVPQSRDRIYVVFWRRGLRPDLELELSAHCGRCDAPRTVRQAWKNNRTAGRYRQQWVWVCVTCGTTCEPPVPPALDALDLSLPCPRIGDRRHPLADATRARIAAGLERFGWATPVVTAGAGNTYEQTPGNRARHLGEALPTRQTSATHALATPPGFLVQPHHTGANPSRVRSVELPLWTVTASDDRPALVDVPGFVVKNHGGWLDPTHAVLDPNSPLATVTARDSHALVVPLRRNAHARPTSEPVPAVTAGGTHHGLVVPYDSHTRACSTTVPVPTVTARDRCALIDPDRLVDDCGFRMLEPHEIAAAMAFPAGYIPDGLTKRDRVRLAGNAVTPPVMAWITGRLAHTLEAAA